VLGDGELGPQQPEQTPDQQMAAQQSMEQEAEIRNTLVTEAYGTTIPSRRTVDKE